MKIVLCKISDTWSIPQIVVYLEIIWKLLSNVIYGITNLGYISRNKHMVLLFFVLRLQNLEWPI